MEALNNLREAIESLSSDEKIDDGKYLEMMNHLKTVYGAIPTEVKPPAWVNEVPVVEEWDFFRDLHRRYFTTIYCENVRNEMWGNPLTIGRQRGDRDAWARFPLVFDSVMRGLGGEEEFAIMWETRGANLIYYLHREELFDDVWKSDEVREKFLSLPCVKKTSLNNRLRCHKRLQGILCPRIVGRAPTYGSDAYWHKMMTDVHFPFTNGFKWAEDKEDPFRMEALSEAQRKKLHNVRITFHMNENDNINWELHTDKIQLGRTACVYALLEMKFVLAMLHPELNTHREAMLCEMKRQRKFGYTCPRLAVSGITANTRTKSRTYHWRDDFTITYTSDLNNGSA